MSINPLMQSCLDCLLGMMLECCESEDLDSQSCLVMTFDPSIVKNDLNE